VTHANKSTRVLSRNPDILSTSYDISIHFFTTDIYNVCFVIVTLLGIVTDVNKETTYVLTYQ